MIAALSFRLWSAARELALICATWKPNEMRRLVSISASVVNNSLHRAVRNSLISLYALEHDRITPSKPRAGWSKTLTHFQSEYPTPGTCTWKRPTISCSDSSSIAHQLVADRRRNWFWLWNGWIHYQQCWWKMVGGLAWLFVFHSHVAGRLCLWKFMQVAGMKMNHGRLDTEHVKQSFRKDWNLGITRLDVVERLPNRGRED